MARVHLDIAYPSLTAFFVDCETCGVIGQHLLNSGEFEYLPNGRVIDTYFFEPEERMPMDVRPTAFESRFNTWRAMEEDGSTTEYQAAVIDLICDLPYHGRVPGYELAPSDILGMYLMGEEL